LSADPWRRTCTSPCRSATLAKHCGQCKSLRGRGRTGRAPAAGVPVAANAISQPGKCACALAASGVQMGSATGSPGRDLPGLAMPPSRQGPLGALAAQRVRKADDRICPKTRCIGRGFRCFGSQAKLAALWAPLLSSERRRLVATTGDELRTADWLLRSPSIGERPAHNGSLGGPDARPSVVCCGEEIGATRQRVPGPRTRPPIEDPHLGHCRGPGLRLRNWPSPSSRRIEVASQVHDFLLVQVLPIEGDWSGGSNPKARPGRSGARATLY